jgi:predicted RNase H-like HicB family nuclease
MIVPISKVQLRRDEDGVWIAKSSLLPGCHAHGRDRGEATLRFQQAAKAHLEALLETGRPIPEAFRDKAVRFPKPFGTSLFSPPDCGKISLMELPPA